MQLSPIRGFNKLAAAEEAQGKKIYHLNIGQPDVKTPEVFMDAVRAYDGKVLCYAESNGITQLLDAIIKYYSLYDITLTRDNIIITNGGSEALKLVFATVLNPGDEIMVPEPYYTNYISFGCETVAVINPVPTTAEDGYAWAVREKLEAALTPKTRAICCNNPNNPTGRVLTREDMRVVCEFAKEHNLWIISDEVYREFVYDGGEVTSFGMMDEFADRIVLVDSVSKRYSACGARIGAVISKNEELMNGVLKLAQGRLCVPTLEQYGAAALFNLGADYLDEARREYESRRDAAYEEISNIPDVICEKPGGSFYLMAKLPIDDAEDFLRFLITEFEDNGESVMFAPAPGFYKTPGKGKNEIRIAYVLNSDKMRRAAELIRLGIEAYRKKKGI